MKPFLHALALCSFFSAFGQSTTNPMLQIAQDLTVQLSREKVKELAFTRLEYSGNSNSEIGKYFADELSFVLVQQGINYKIMSVTQSENAVAQHLAKQKQSASSSSTGSTRQSAPTNNSNSNEKQEDINWVLVGGAAALLAGVAIFAKDKGPLHKVTHFISGTIVDKGDELEVTYTILNKKKYNVANARGRFLKTPDILNILNPVHQPAISQPNPLLFPTPGTSIDPVSPPSSIAASWRNNSIVMELKSCTQSGQNIECELQVTARESNLDLSIRRDQSSLIAAENQYQYTPMEVVIIDKSTTGYQVDRHLIAKHNARVVLRFSQVNQRVKNIAALFIHCWDSVSGHYWIELNNIPVY
jgi:hypothetical protein